MTIGERIKARRHELNLSVDDVAEKLGKNRATVYRYESDMIYHLPITVLEPLAEILKCSPGYLMGWTDDAEIKQKVELTKDENTLVSKYRKLNTDGKQKADEYITDLSEQPKYTTMDSGNIAEDIAKEIQRAIALGEKHTSKR